ncbi:MAG: primase-helicase family protein [Promethearchaeota archaeon]
MVSKTQAIKSFLKDHTVSDLAALYDFNMEVQVNVAQDSGEPIQKKDGFTGRLWRGYTDGVQTWKSFRIPWNAATEPEYKDSDLHWDLSQHAEGIGLTGWDWVNKVSKWVAFDFDSLIGHSGPNRLTAIELQQVKEAACAIPWVTVRKSTSGQGLHLYVFLNDIKTNNHTEHAALARAILSKMVATAGFEFNTKIDVCGGNMWIWHRKMRGTDGLTLIKEGSILEDVPINWKDHLVVIKGVKRKNVPNYIPDQEVSTFEQLTGQRPYVKLDERHKELLKYLEEINALWWYDSDHHLLVCHTYDLKRAHNELNLRGIFNTVATGNSGASNGGDHNCFCFPLEQPEGAWVVRRFTPGVQESDSWTQDISGWTKCYFNREPTLHVAARSFNGIEDEKGEYLFTEAEVASTALTSLGADLQLPTWACNRQVKVKPHKDGRRLIVRVKREVGDKQNEMPGWKEEKDWWAKIFDARLLRPEPVEPQNYDNFIRHVITTCGDDYGWVLKAANSWHNEPVHHVKLALKSLGLSETEINKTLGKCVMEGWMLVNKPFEPEHPGNREWNRNAVQFRYPPQQEEPFKHSTWDRIINHCGFGLNEGVKNNGWCQANGIETGADYLRVWIASLFQFPSKQLPYLFFYSREQQTGKSTLHEAIKLLMTDSGYTKGNTALINSGGFNAELENVILCALDECDLRKNSNARNRMKDWITSTHLLIHPKLKTPYLIENTVHFIQTGNDPGECTIDTGDDRVIMIQVNELEPIDRIPKSTLFGLLTREAPAFLATLLKLEIPPCNDRLNIPVITTELKQRVEQDNRSLFDVFLDEKTHYAPGESIKYNDLFAHFSNWLDPSEVHEWTKIKMGRSLPSKYPKGRLSSDSGQYHIGNISFTQPETISSKKFILQNSNLVLI